MIIANPRSALANGTFLISMVLTYRNLTKLEASSPFTLLAESPGGRSNGMRGRRLAVLEPASC